MATVLICSAGQFVITIQKSCELKVDWHWGGNNVIFSQKDGLSYYSEGACGGSRRARRTTESTKVLKIWGRPIIITKPNYLERYGHEAHLRWEELLSRNIFFLAAIHRLSRKFTYEAGSRRTLTASPASGDSPWGNFARPSLMGLCVLCSREFFNLPYEKSCTEFILKSLCSWWSLVIFVAHREAANMILRQAIALTWMIL